MVPRDLNIGDSPGFGGLIQGQIYNPVKIIVPNFWMIEHSLPKKLADFGEGSNFFWKNGWLGLPGCVHHGRINILQPKNHPEMKRFFFLNQTSMIVFQMFIFQGVLGGSSQL